MADAPLDPLTALERRLGAEWIHLRKAREMSAAKRQEIAKLAMGLDSEDTSIVVSGSLARDEFTDGSDIDWSLLIDGSADPKHYDLLRKIGSVVDTLAAKPPGPEVSIKDAADDIVVGDVTKHEVIERLQSIFRATPLEIVSEVLLRYPHLDGSATKVLGTYDGFVGILSDSQQRKRLEDLKEEDADDDETYQKARSMSHDFRDGLLEFFFDEKSDICNLTKNYGVF